MQGFRVGQRALVVSACLFAGVSQMVACSSGRTDQSPVVGVWQVAEVTTTGPNARTVTNPQPGLYIFTPGHYAQERVTSDTPRAELPPADQRTDKQAADAFGPFAANAGSYEIKDNEITIKRTVAKDPTAMKAGNLQVLTFRLEGKDALWLTQKASQAGPVQNPTTIKLTRVE
jgi:hypothetical protein